MSASHRTHDKNALLTLEKMNQISQTTDANYHIVIFSPKRHTTHDHCDLFASVDGAVFFDSFEAPFGWIGVL